MHAGVVPLCGGGDLSVNKATGGFQTDRCRRRYHCKTHPPTMLKHPTMDRNILLPRSCVPGWFEKRFRGGDYRPYSNNRRDIYCTCTAGDHHVQYKISTYINGRAVGSILE